MSTYKNPPEFNSSKKPFDRYIEKLRGWSFVTDLPASKQGVNIALTLPEDDKSGIREKVFNKLSLQVLGGDTGLGCLIEYMENLFKKDEINEVYEQYVLFDRYVKSPNENMEDYFIEFEKRYNRIKQKSTILPSPILAFRLLDSSGLDTRDRQLVLIGVNCSVTDTLFNQMKSALRKVYGEQVIPNTNTQVISIVKEEPVLKSQLTPFFTITIVPIIEVIQIIQPGEVALIQIPIDNSTHVTNQMIIDPTTAIAVIPIL